MAFICMAYCSLVAGIEFLLFFATTMQTWKHLGLLEDPLPLSLDYV